MHNVFSPGDRVIVLPGHPGQWRGIVHDLAPNQKGIPTYRVFPVGELKGLGDAPAECYAGIVRADKMQLESG